VNGSTLLYERLLLMVRPFSTRGFSTRGFSTRGFANANANDKAQDRQAHQPGKGFLFALSPVGELVEPLPLTLFPTSTRNLMTND
ncbi:hypothetical protein VF13_33195, partial [Nostoc linckia z16]